MKRIARILLPIALLLAACGGSDNGALSGDDGDGIAADSVSYVFDADFNGFVSHFSALEFDSLHLTHKLKGTDIAWATEPLDPQFRPSLNLESDITGELSAIGSYTIDGTHSGFLVALARPGGWHDVFMKVSNNTAQVLLDPVYWMASYHSEDGEEETVESWLLDYDRNGSIDWITRSEEIYSESGGPPEKWLTDAILLLFKENKFMQVKPGNLAALNQRFKINGNAGRIAEANGSNPAEENGEVDEGIPAADGTYCYKINRGKPAGGFTLTVKGGRVTGRGWRNSLTAHEHNKLHLEGSFTGAKYILKVWYIPPAIEAEYNADPAGTKSKLYSTTESWQVRGTEIIYYAPNGVEVGYSETACQ